MACAWVCACLQVHALTQLGSIKMCDLLDLVANDDDDVESLPLAPQSGIVSRGAEDDLQNKSEATQTSEHAFKGMSMKGRVGAGRHGTKMERTCLAMHMRSQKRARSDHKLVANLCRTLKGSTFKKHGKAFRVQTKTKGGGLVITLNRIGQKGNRYVRRIPWCSFLEAAYSQVSSHCNVAVAAKLDVDASTVPKLQKTCALQGMHFQMKLLKHLLNYCKRNRPVAVAKILNYFTGNILVFVCFFLVGM